MDRKKVELIAQFFNLFDHNVDWNWLMTAVTLIELEGYYLQTTRTQDLQFAEFRVGDGAHVYVQSKGSCDASDPEAKFKAIFDAVYDYTEVQAKRRENVLPPMEH